ncbi:methyltransferase [Sulfitobacter sp. D35]|uniref:methyltransferase n=1 Tax=Sulfitobacter sp. D35 TaxID=3083252 RepID=UPI00296E7AE6|nr:methyltransferase [Sulfitobacter sp. D35]MDW4496659.1 methyltransferase [Sulfitobacter sp. D35]
MRQGLYPEDEYLATLPAVAALLAASRLGLLDRLVSEGMPVSEVLRAGPGARLLIDTLTSAGILVQDDDHLVATPGFAQVWRARGDHAVARLEMTARAARDALTRPEMLLGAFDGFMADSETFRLFRYDRAFGDSAAHVAATRPYCDYVGSLTAAEAPQLVAAASLDGAGEVLEIGGNAGVLAGAFLERHADLHYTVMDLPAVCRIGAERTAGRPWANRLRFLPGDARRDRWPGPVDAVVFKSMLHDWPDDQARAFLALARDALRPGGRVLVMERAPVDGLPADAPVSAFTDVVFAPFFRPPERYCNWMTDAGLSAPEVTHIGTAPPFYVFEAHKPGPEP